MASLCFLGPLCRRHRWKSDLNVWPISDQTFEAFLSILYIQSLKYGPNNFFDFSHILFQKTFVFGCLSKKYVCKFYVYLVFVFFKKPPVRCRSLPSESVIHWTPLRVRHVVVPRLSFFVEHKKQLLVSTTICIFTIRKFLSTRYIYNCVLTIHRNAASHISEHLQWGKNLWVRNC